MRNTLCILFLFATACADRGVQSKDFGIYIDGDYKDVAPSDVDWALRMAASAADINPAELARDTILVTFVDRPILCPESPNGLCAGHTYGTDTQVMHIPGGCVLSSHSTLIHEFFHMALSVATGSEDPNHTDRRWHAVNAMDAPCGRFN